MKKICIDVRMIKKNISGIGNYEKNIIKILFDIMPDWYFYLIGDKNNLENNGIKETKRIKIIQCSIDIYTIKEQFVIYKLIPKDINLFWCPHFNIPFFYNKKMLVTIHDVCHLAIPEAVGGKFKSFCARIYFEFIRYKAKCILTVSDFSKKEIEKYLHYENIPIIVSRLGVDKEWFSFGNKKKPYILFVGNIKPHKNLITLIKAFKEIENKIDLNLVIVGKKEGFINTDNKVLNFESKRIIFTDFVDDRTLKQLYAEAEIFVFPSIYEGFGLPILEAMASNTLVISSNAASLPEIGLDGPIYYNPLDYKELSNIILKVMVNNKIKEKHIKRSAVIAKKYSWENTAMIVKNTIEKYSE